MAFTALLTTFCALPASPPIDIDREEAQRRANEQVSKLGTNDQVPEWLLELRQRVEEFWGGVSGNGLSWGFLVAIFVVLAIAVFVVWRVGLPRRQAKTRVDADIGVDQSVMPSTYRDLADESAAAGDYRTAIRERFRAIVRELEFRTIISPRPSRTAFEAAAVASRELPAASAPLHVAAEVFSAVMYGDEPGSIDGWARILDAERAITHAADQPGVVS